MRRFIRKVLRVGKLEPGKPRRIPVHHGPPAEPVFIPRLCDACHLTRAIYTATHWGMLKSLYFCGAHYRKNKEALEAQGWEVREAQ